MHDSPSHIFYVLEVSGIKRKEGIFVEDYYVYVVEVSGEGIATTMDPSNHDEELSTFNLYGEDEVTNVDHAFLSYTVKSVKRISYCGEKRACLY